MPKRRMAAPKPVAEAVLKEYRHRCAICGGDRPHLHHIDNDPANNDPKNLIPLCPNCHLTDQHDPTAPADPRKLKLFREHKDPLILTPQFEPLFRRLTFLLDVDTSFSFDHASAAAEELRSFVAALQMGQFYSSQLAELVAATGFPMVWFPDMPEETERRQLRDRAESYRQKLLANRDAALRLSVELLRYQNWPPARTDLG